MKPDSNGEKPITVDGREFIFRANSLNVVQRYYILGIFIGRKTRRVLHKTRPKQDANLTVQTAHDFV